MCRCPGRHQADAWIFHCSPISWRRFARISPQIPSFICSHGLMRWPVGEALGNISCPLEWDIESMTLHSQTAKLTSKGKWKVMSKAKLLAELRHLAPNSHKHLWRKWRSPNPVLPGLKQKEENADANKITTKRRESRRDRMTRLKSWCLVSGMLLMSSG